jgi:uncharacterized protein (TIGR02118 family)
VSAVKVLILYSKSEGSSFNPGHWLEVHRPLVSSGLWENATDIEFSLCRESDSYYAVATAKFSDRTALLAALATSHGEEVSADIPNFFSGQPTILVTDLA